MSFRSDRQQETLEATQGMERGERGGGDIMLQKVSVRRAVLIVVSLVGLFVLVTLFVGRDVHIQFFLPHDMLGEFVVIEDSDGTAPQSTGVLSATHLISVPSSRVVRLPSTSMFFHWHSIVGVRPDGTIVPFDYGVVTLPDGGPDPARVAPEDIAIRDCGESKSGGSVVLRYFIGTQQDAENAEFTPLVQLWHRLSE